MRRTQIQSGETQKSWSMCWWWGGRKMQGGFFYAGWVLLHPPTDPGLPPSCADMPWSADTPAAYSSISDRLRSATVKILFQFCKVSKSSSLPSPHSTLIYFQGTRSPLTMGKGWEKRLGCRKEAGKGHSQVRERWPDTQTAMVHSLFWIELTRLSGHCIYRME